MISEGVSVDSVEINWGQNRPRLTPVLDSDSNDDFDRRVTKQISPHWMSLKVIMVLS